ncbi:MAG TPA: hypothetical protein VGI46_18360 [Candidatus Acidoferrum sp.]|jgi:drug/metabolite transporter (DMT)-like permease
MASRLHAGNERRGYLGKFLMALGSVALLADFSVLIRPLEQVVERLQNGLFSLIPALGLSFMNTAREIAFHQFDYFSLVSRILVLFTALVAIVIGAVVLSTRSAAADQRGSGVSVEGDR